ncbi:MAG: PQQ-dependent sugar dehydrogenase [Polyangiaceae bacterium]|nr:PQQ-dependent sugar dehydrogenase [Polyangiaceae bacterium]
MQTSTLPNLLLAVGAASLLAFSAGCDGGETGQGGSAGSTSTGGGGSSTTSTSSSGGTTDTGGGGTGGTPIPVDYDCSPAEGAVPALQLTEVAGGFERPILVKSAPGDNDRLFVVEQVGKIWIVQNGQVLPDPFLDIQADVANPDAPNGYHQEQGLLGLAFHPDYATNGRFFVHYSNGPFSDSNPKGDTRIVEFKRSADPNKADAAPVQTILTEPQPYTNHNGGSIEFSPKDGFLYIGFGDGGAGGDPLDSGQDKNSRLGKILRLDVDSMSPYAIPPGNMVGGNPEIWDMGLRNPWRFSFDLCTGDLYIGEVGQDELEEIDVEKAGQGGKNYGWNTMEGTQCFEPSNGCDQTGLTLPVTEYNHLTGKSVTGGYVYRGKDIPGLRGTYFYADYVTDKMWMFKWEGQATVTPVDLTNQLSGIAATSSFGQDNFGNVYVVSMYGNIYRIEAQ